MPVLAESTAKTTVRTALTAMAAMYATQGLGNIYLQIILMYMTMYNIMFGVFNLIPIPPLDGADVLAEFLPYKARVSYMKFSRYGMIVLLAMMVFGLFGYIITPIVNWIYQFYGWILGMIFGAF